MPCRSRANLTGWHFSQTRVAKCFCPKRMLSSSALTRCSDRSCPHSQHCYTLVTHIPPGPAQDAHSCHPARSWCSSWGNWPLRMGRGLLRPSLHLQLSAQDGKYLDIQGCPAHCRQVSAAAHLPGKNSQLKAGPAPVQVRPGFCYVLKQREVLHPRVMRPQSGLKPFAFIHFIQ